MENDSENQSLLTLDTFQNKSEFQLHLPLREREFLQVLGPSKISPGQLFSLNLIPGYHNPHLLTCNKLLTTNTLL